MKDNPVAASSVCAIIVTYHPGPDLIHNVSLLSPQVDAIVVVDNASSGASLDRINELSRQSRCTVIRNERNLGMAAALNIGFRFAIERGYEWIVTFDQDSTVLEGFIEALLNTARISVGTAIVCPTYMDQVSHRVMQMPRTSSGELMTTMTSGSMMHRSTYERAGPFDERLYIDSVDNEYCLRVRSMGLRLLQSDGAVLLHSLGRLTVHRFLGTTLSTTNHSAARRYYITRNRLFVLSRYRRDLQWLRIELRAMLKDVLAIALFEQDRFAKFRSMTKAVVDCARGRWGAQVPL